MVKNKTTSPNKTSSFPTTIPDRKRLNTMMKPEPSTGEEVTKRSSRRAQHKDTIVELSELGDSKSTQSSAEHHKESSHTPLLVPNQLHKYHYKRSAVVQALQSCISLKLFLPLFIVLSIMIPLILIVVLSAVYMNESTHKLLLQMQHKTSDMNILFLTQFLDPRLMVESIGNELTVGALSLNLDEKTDRKLMWRHLQNNRKADQNSIYVTTTSGNMLGYMKESSDGGDDTSYLLMTITPDTFGQWRLFKTDPTNGDPTDFLFQAPFDPRTRDWYSQTMEKKRLTFTKIYDFSSSGESQTMGITASVPVFSDTSENSNSDESTETKLMGVVSVDYTLRALSLFLAENKVWKDGEIFIIERDGLMVASSTDSVTIVSANGLTNRITCDRSPNALISAACHYLLTKYDSFNEVHDEALDRGDDDHLMSEKFGSNRMVITTFEYNQNDISWLMISIIPERVLGSVMNRVSQLIIISLVVLFVTVILAFLVTWCLIVWPLDQMSYQMSKVSKMDFNNISHSTTIFSEFAKIQSAFLSMIVALESFRRYVPDAITKRAMNDDLNDTLTRDTSLTQVYMTAFSLNISEFGRMSEQLIPSDLELLLKEVHEIVSNILPKYGATIDTFSGDSVLVMFNAHSPLEKHQKKACEAALECRKALLQKKEEWNRRGIEDVNCRIGIHSDMALVGSVGSRNGSNYTAIGPAISITNTLESLSKHYRTSILISGDIHSQVQDYFVCRVVDVVNSQKVGAPKMTVYELLEARDYCNSNSVLMLEKWTGEWKRNWEQGNVPRALHCLQQALGFKEYHRDYNLNMLKKRCEYCLNDPARLVRSTESSSS